MSHLEDQEEGVLSLWIQPNDLILENSVGKTFLEKIAGYKILISRAIYNKYLESLNLVAGGDVSVTLQNAGKQIISALVEKTLAASGVDVNDETDRLRKLFMQEREIRIYIDDIDRG